MYKRTKVQFSRKIVNGKGPITCTCIDKLTRSDHTNKVQIDLSMINRSTNSWEGSSEKIQLERAIEKSSRFPEKIEWKRSN